MKRVLMLGGGKVGSLIACLLSGTGDYELHVGDTDSNAIRNMEELGCAHLTVHRVDALNRTDLERFLESRQLDAVISCLPYYCNFTVAEMAIKFGLHYFDLTEDVEVARFYRKNQRECRDGFRASVRPGSGLHQHHRQ
jgi:saccharopine dehydrogenase-like NADP-dependent oxidoreductase